MSKNFDRDAILLESYIAYVLSQGNKQVNSSEIKSFAEHLRNTAGNNNDKDSIRKAINRYKNKLIEIGALNSGARIHTNRQTKEQCLLKDDYTFSLKPFTFENNKHLKMLYIIVLLLNTECSPKKETNIETIKNAYFPIFGNDEAAINDLIEAIDIIGDLFFEVEKMNDDDFSKDTIKDIKRLFEKTKYSNIFSAIAQIKLDPSFGYSPNEYDCES